MTRKPTTVRSPSVLIGKPLTSTPRLHESDHPIPSPASTVASLTRELEDTLHTLDLQAAMRGLYVVKPQVSNSMLGSAVYIFCAFVFADFDWLNHY